MPKRREGQKGWRLGRLLLTALVLALWCAPARASTVPPLDLGPSGFTAALGLDVLGPSATYGSFDYALTDRLSIGGAGLWGLYKAYGDESSWMNHRWAALRGGYRLLSSRGHEAMVGVSVSVGISNVSARRFPYGYVPGYHLFVQPAVNFALAIPTPWDLRGSLKSAPLTVRGTVGPAFGSSVMVFQGQLTAIPINVEIAYRLGRHHEVVLGGANGIVPTGISWRSTFHE